MADGDTTKLVGNAPGSTKRSNSYTQPYEFSAEVNTSKHYTAGLHRVGQTSSVMIQKYLKSVLISEKNPKSANVLGYFRRILAKVRVVLVTSIHLGMLSL